MENQAWNIYELYFLAIIGITLICLPNIIRKYNNFKKIKKEKTAEEYWAEIKTKRHSEIKG